MSAVHPSAPVIDPVARPVPAPRVLVRYGIDGDLRFISHHDEIRMLTRAIVRAGWPLAYSGGFNPAPRLAILLPRPVGMAARNQLALVRVITDVVPGALATALVEALPRQFLLEDVATVPPGVAPRPRTTTYELAVAPDDRAALPDRIASFLARGDWRVDRVDRDGHRRGWVDIRPAVREVELNESTLRVTRDLEAGVSARPEELLAALGLPGEAYGHRWVRARVLWNIQSAGAPRHAAPNSEEVRSDLDKQVQQED